MRPSPRFVALVAQLEALLEQCREDLGDSQTKREGKNVRLAGLLTVDTE